MADKEQNTSSNKTKTFDKSLNKDINDFHLPENEWSGARNAINNSITGDLGKLGNEPANLLCVLAPYPIIGFIHIIEDKWAVFSTDNTNSEIGLFIESNCNVPNPTINPAYTTIVNAPCLSFDLDKLIIGTARSLSTCRYRLYWDDGINPSRVLEIDVDNPLNNLPFLPPPAPPGTNNPNSPIPWVQNCVDSNGANPGGCIICTNTPVLDCDKLRLALFMEPICPRIEKGINGGNLLNGSYFVVMAYSVNGQKISDWYVSNVQGLWTHDNVQSSIDVFIDRIDQDFDEIILGLGSVVNEQTVVRQAGLYSTRQTRFSFDSIQASWPSIPIEQLPLMTPIVDKSDAIYNVGDYLIRVGPTNKEDFNYQPFANQITAKWQSVEYPADYYYKGNNLVGYMRDEVYPFFIEYIYDTGDKSASYHIPGRPPILGPLAINSAHPGNGVIAPATSGETSAIAAGGNAFNAGPFWQTYNTATYTALAPTTAPDGVGQIIAEGLMGYWESSEYYPDKTPQIWNPSDPSHPWTAITSLPYAGTTPANYDLCGTPIRHHKFPEDTVGANATLCKPAGQFIRLMGIKFGNIKAPRDNNGKLIPGIVGYHILRGTRNGNKSIIAKGIINNMHKFETKGQTKPALYPNYPYNDLRDDPFLSTTQSRTTACINTAGGIVNVNTMPGGFGPQGFSDTYYTFHSPDTNFNNPFLAAKEFRIYGNTYGLVDGKFDYSEKHPKEKLVSDFAFMISAIAGAASAVGNVVGERRVNRRLPTYQGMSFEQAYFLKNDYNLTQNTTGSGSGSAGPITAVGTVPYFASFTIASIPWIGSGSSSGTTTGDTLWDSNSGDSVGVKSSPTPTDELTINPKLALITGYNTSYTTSILSGTPLLAAIGGVPLTDQAFGTAQTLSNTARGTNFALANGSNDIQQTDGHVQKTPILVAAATGLPVFLNYFTSGTDSFINLIRAMLRFRDFAVRYHSHGFYSNLITVRPDIFRRPVNNQQYINPEILDYDLSYKINNLFRQRTVVIQTTQGLLAPYQVGGAATDRTRYTASELIPKPQTIQELVDTPVTNANTTDGGAGQICSSWYGALKIRVDNQYGQLNNIVQVHTSPCYTQVKFDSITGAIIPGQGDTTTVLFGGDTYVNRYTEKNTFLYFYDWLYGQPNGAQFDYKQHQMIPYPKYWADFSAFQTSDFTTTFFQWITSFGTSGFSNIKTPSDFYVLDGPQCSSFFAGSYGNQGNALAGFRFDKRGWFYLFNSGVRDFFVESDINTAYRDYGELPEQRFFNPYAGGDTKTLFDTNIIKSGNYYKYDKSLSISQLFLNYASWASTQAPSYDPYLAETCFVYRPKRLIYSLPGQFEGLKDGWRVFLPNNYSDFLNLVTAIKPVNKSGAMIFFDAASPVQFQGTDQLQTELGTKLTIGDGGLFSQPVQSIVNVDSSHEYASCQNRMSVINTPAGLFWISQNQGKVFNLTSGIKEVSNEKLKWWFNQYLPYDLTKSFPDFTLLDNPVIGIGCQSIYDNENGLIYFCKKDYKLRTDITETVTYIGSSEFEAEGGLRFRLGDENSSLFFDDASWTASYDPKTGAWIGWHDWHPTLNMPGKNTFMSINPNDKRGIWIHNTRCDLYCNYYGLDYPFEVEFTINTGQTVDSLRSIEYIMEAYKYAPNCYDRFHVLDYNFDEAIIYNTEQVSGLLKLNLSPKDDPAGILTYPIINPTDIDILFSKVENKYRFNQFWDITDNRGEFFDPAIPGFAQRPIWDTEANGYIRALNPVNLNYNKESFQRKKFRHYTTSVLLRRKFSGDRKMLVMIANTKDLYSPR